MNLWPHVLNVRWVYPLMQREASEEVDYFEVVFLLKQRRKHAISFVTNFWRLGVPIYFRWTAWKLLHRQLQMSHKNAAAFSTGSRVVRALASHQCGPGSIPARCHMWFEFVVSSRYCIEGFSPGSPVFLPPQKTNTPNSNSTRIEDQHENQLRLMWLPL